ncbi:MAG: DUF2851 family protein [Bacteroidetes bacterium]|jgi:hypothetical protein|nr:DUF2851 family protein [Bacteroidota bacterium]
MKEIFLIYLWENKLLRAPLITEDGNLIEIIHPGFRNDDSGPDFLNARIMIDNTVWAGNVEIHISASDWYNHRHHADKSYDNVILHVVYNADKTTFTTLREEIPVLSVKDCFDETILLRYRSFIDSQRWIPCENFAGEIQRFTWLSWLDRMIVDRLQMKVEDVIQILSQTGNDWEVTFYQRLLSNFGLKVNDVPFGQLARNLPFQILLRHSDQLFQLEAILFGTAGLLESEFIDPYPQSLKREFEFLQKKYNLTTLKAEQWRFMRMRPANFPTLRLSQFAALIHKNGRLFSKIIQAETPEQIKEYFVVNASSYWDNHFRFDTPSVGHQKNLGQNATSLLIINTVVQMLFTYGLIHENEQAKDKALVLLENMDAENNEIIRKFDKIGVHASNALQSQSLLHLKKFYCSPKRCLECRIGHIIFKSDNQKE